MNKKIYEDYKLFNISQSEVNNQYTDANNFAKNIQRCGVLKDIPVTYTTSSKMINK